MKIDWFGVVPGAGESWLRTLRWVEALARQHDVCLWLREGSFPESTPLAIPEGVARRFYPETDSWRWLNRGDLAVFQLGDQPDHSMGAWAISREHRGLLILEEESLHRVVYWWFRHRSLAPDYVALLRRSYGRLGAEAARQAVDNPKEVEELRLRYPLLDFAASNCLGVMVPNRGLLARARQWVCPVAYCPLPSAYTSGGQSSESGMGRWLHRFEQLAAFSLEERCQWAQMVATRGFVGEVGERVSPSENFPSGSRWWSEVVG